MDLHARSKLIWALLFIVFHNLNRTALLCQGEEVPSAIEISGTSTSPVPDITGEKNVFLKSCCNDNANSNGDNSCSFNSSSSFIVKWNNLKFYRIPKKNASFVESTVTSSSTSADIHSRSQLRCDNNKAISLTIPRWEDLQSSSFSKGSFAAFHSDGHFHYDKYLFSPENYCVERYSPKEVLVIACNYSDYCTNPWGNVCLTRCCNYGEVFDVSGKFQCVDSGNFKWEPQIHSAADDISLESINSDSGDALKMGPLVISNHPRDLIKTTCKSDSTWHSSHPRIQNDGRLQKMFGRRPFRVSENGTVWMKLRKHEWVQLNPGEYCLDGFQFGKGTFSGDNEEVLLFECKSFETEAEVQQNEVQRELSLGYGIILIICLMFLFATALVYMLLWSKHNIHGWTVFCYIVALLITFLLLGTSHFATISLTREKKAHGSTEIVTFCGIIGVLSHFAFLSAFSWSTVLNFDLWCTFRSLRPTTNDGKSKGLKRFLLYFLFALVVPSAIVAAGIVLDLKYMNDVFSDVVTPEYGKSICYVEPKYARFYFVILPIAVLLGVNLILFCNTGYSLYKAKKSTTFARSSSTRKEIGNQTFRLILKLLLVNGTIWIAEIVSWYLQTDYNKIGVISFLLDVVNAFQAVAIFFMFVFKKDILESLKRSYQCLEGPVNLAFKLKRFGRIRRSREINTGTGTTRTSTSFNNSKANESTRVTKV